MESNKYFKLLIALLIVLFFVFIYLQDKKHKQEVFYLKLELDIMDDVVNNYIVLNKKIKEEYNDLFEQFALCIESEKRLNDEVARLHGRKLDISYYE